MGDFEYKLIWETSDSVLTHYLHFSDDFTLL